MSDQNTPAADAEPVAAWLYEKEGSRCFSSKRQGQHPEWQGWTETPLYTADQLQAYGDTRAREALERAAKVAWAVEPMPEYPVEQSHLSAFHYGKDRAFEAIRALKENPNG